MHVAAHQDSLRRLALHDEDWIASLLAIDVRDVAASGLDARTHALLRLAALMALGAPPVSYQSSVEAALAAGATADEVVGALIAVAPIIGLPRVISSVPRIAPAIGYDLDAALERLNGDPY
jgi:alkylhydroperoxidase/carboxymuconolactone decarboxylase family protein YurZ